MSSSEISETSEPTSSGPGSGIFVSLDTKNRGDDEACPIEHDATVIDIASSVAGILNTGGEGRFEVLNGVTLPILRRVDGLGMLEAEGDDELVDDECEGGDEAADSEEGRGF